MDHPDFNMTPVAGTSFYSGEMYQHREWAKIKEKWEIGDSFESEGEIYKIIGKKDNKFLTQNILDKSKMIIEENLLKKHYLKEIKGEINHFHKSKLNRKENKDYYKYMAKDIAAQGSVDDYLTRQSHGKWEGHLPSFVPISQFAEVVIDKKGTTKLFILLEDSDKEFAKIVKDTEDTITGIAKNMVLQERGMVIDYLKSKYKLNIKEVGSSDNILPYMNKGFKEGKWSKK